MTDKKAKQPSFDAIFRKGTSLLHAGKAEEAVPLLRQAYQMQSENVDVAINLSGALILVRKFKQAIKVLEPVAELAPDNGMVWINLGAAYLGNPVLARDKEQLASISAFKKALAIDPAAPSSAYNIGLICEDRKENEEAIKWFEKALQVNPHDDHAGRKLNRLKATLESGDVAPE